MKTHTCEECGIEISHKCPTGLKKKAPKEKPIFAPDSQPWVLAFYLDSLLRKNDPERSPASSNQLKSWAIDLNRLLTRDQRAYQQILAVMDWCQQDSFWKTNILTAKKFREQYPRLLLRMKEDKKKLEMATQTQSIVLVKRKD